MANAQEALMARITTPEKGFNGVVAGVTFNNGVGETHSIAAISYFNRKGYGVKGGADAEQSQPVEPAPTHPEGEPSDKWTKDQLKAYAKEHDIDLGEAKNKDDIVAVLVTPLDSGAGDTPDPSGD